MGQQQIDRSKLRIAMTMMVMMIFVTAMTLTLVSVDSLAVSRGLTHCRSRALLITDRYTTTPLERRCRDAPFVRSPVLSSTASSLISPEDYWSIWTCISGCAATGLYLERKTTVGAALSAPVCAMLLSATLTNCLVLPPDGSIHITNLLSFVVKLATPLLLLSADLKAIYQDSGPLFKAFLLGTLGTLVGSFTAFLLLSSTFSRLGMNSEAWKLAGALTAKNIGGGLNFIAVVDTLKVSPQMISLGLAVDNIMGLLYFPLLSWLGTRYNKEKESQGTSNMFAALSTPPSYEMDGQASMTSSLSSSGTAAVQTKIVPGMVPSDMLGFCSALSIGLALVSVSDHLASLWFMRQLGLPSIVLSTLLSVFLATLFPRTLHPNVTTPAEVLGKLLLLLFFGGIGTASGNILQTLRSPLVLPLLLFVFVLYSLHFLVIYGYGRRFLPLPDILLGSNANIGNAATATALATGLNWTDKVVPAMLIGNFGNFIGTFAGLYLATVVLRPMCMWFQ